jgi:hypothetical protein
VRLKFVLLLFEMRKVCEMEAGMATRAQDHSENALTSALIGARPGVTIARRQAASRPIQPLNAEIGDRKSHRPFTFG